MVLLLLRTYLDQLLATLEVERGQWELRSHLPAAAFRQVYLPLLNTLPSLWEQRKDELLS